MSMKIETSAVDTNASTVSFRNVFSEGTLSWSSQTPDGFAANALGPQTYDAWVPASVPATLTVALAVATKCYCAAIIAHTLGSSGNTLYVEGSLDNSTWVTVSTVVPTDDSDIFTLFSAPSDTAYQYWRIRITGGTPPAVGIAWIGPVLRFPLGVQASYVPIRYGLDIQMSVSSTIKGQFVGSYIERKGGSATITLAPQEREWVQTTAQPFIDHFNAAKPFLWMSCPDKLPEDAHYVWRSGNTLNASFGPGVMYADINLGVSAYVA